MRVAIHVDLVKLSDALASGQGELISVQEIFQAERREQRQILTRAAEIDADPALMLTMVGFATAHFLDEAFAAIALRESRVAFAKAEDREHSRIAPGSVV